MPFSCRAFFLYAGYGTINKKVNVMIFAALRNGVKSTLRARKRSVLFMVLMILLTLVLTVGAGFYITADQLVKEANDIFISSVKIEYLGESYPSRTVYDSYVRKAAEELDVSAWKDIEGIRSWNPTNDTLCYSDDFFRAYSERPFKDSGVFLVKELMRPGSGGRWNYEDYKKIHCIAIVERDLTGSTGVQDLIVKLEVPSSALRSILKVGGDGKYLIHGDLVTNNTFGSMMKTIRVVNFRIDTDEAPVHRITGKEDPYLSQSAFTDQAKVYQGTNNYIILRSAASVEALDEFQQAEIQLTDGRFPQAGEKGVCVISGHIATATGLKVGDKIAPEVLKSGDTNYFDLYPSNTKREFTIVGIASESSFYEGNIWVSDAEANPEAKIFGYELGVLRVDNDSGPEITQKISETLPEQITATLLDQGYKTAIEPIKTMRTVALAVVLAVTAGLISTISLFAFLMITRQRESYNVMNALGTSSAGVNLWFLGGVVFLSIPAALVGCAAGIFILKKVLSLVFEKIAGIEQTHYYFSETMMGLTKELPVPKTFEWEAGIAVTAGVVLFTLVACAVALFGMRREAAVKQGAGKLRPAKKDASMFARGSLRYAVLSIRRNPVRSLITPLVSCVLACVIGVFAMIQNNAGNRIAEVYANTAIEGRLTSFDGTLVRDLVVDPEAVRDLMRTGIAKDISVSMSTKWNYWVHGDMPDFSDAGGGFSAGADQELDWMTNQPRMSAINRIYGAPELYFNTPVVTWLEGYNEDILSVNQIEDIGDPDLTSLGRVKTYPAVCGKMFLENHGASLGDFLTIDYYYPFPGYGTSSLRVKVVGSYAQSSDRAGLYIPLCFSISPEWLFDAESTEHDIYNRNLQSVRFRIDPATELDDFRDKMYGLGYGEPNHIGPKRMTLQLKDSVFTETVSSLKRFSIITNILLPILMGVICLIGFLVSWLLIHGRRSEFAMMRGFGVRYGRTNMSFLLEQILLCVIGVGIAALILYLTGVSSLRTWIYLGFFMLMYLDGAAIAVRLVAKGSLMRLLQDAE